MPPAPSKTKAPGVIRVGIGGWVFPPWRNNFYPEGLAQRNELEYASRQLSAIEINATYHRLQKPASFAKWRDATPPGFVFSVKGSQYVTNRRVLGEAGEAIGRFMASGLAELGPKLGPIVWQFATTKVFDPADFESFLKLLPGELEGQKLRHAVEVRHPSFMTPEFLALVRRRGVATVFADSDKYPSFADASGDFVYARLMMTESKTQDRLCAAADPLLVGRGAPLGGARRSPSCRGDRARGDAGQARATCSPSSSAAPRKGRRERRRPCSPSSGSSRSRCRDAKRKASRLPKQRARPRSLRGG